MILLKAAHDAYAQHAGPGTSGAGDVDGREEWMEVANRLHEARVQFDAAAGAGGDVTAKKRKGGDKKEVRHAGEAAALKSSGGAAAAAAAQRSAAKRRRAAAAGAADEDPAPEDGEGPSSGKAPRGSAGAALKGMGAAIGAMAEQRATAQDAKLADKAADRVAAKETADADRAVKVRELDLQERKLLLQEQQQAAANAAAGAERAERAAAAATAAAAAAASTKLMLALVESLSKR